MMLALVWFFLVAGIFVCAPAAGYAALGDWPKKPIARTAILIFFLIYVVAVMIFFPEGGSC